jgi:hypothetical protein
VAVAVHSIEPVLELYRDGLGGEYLMGGDQDSWRWLQLRYPGGGKANLRPAKSHGTLIQIAQSAAPDEVARARLQPGNLEEL